MYAVIETGGKQYRVAAGQTVKIETLEVEPGQAFDFDKVLMVADGDDIKLGTPYIEGMKVNASVVDHGRHKKIKIVKFRRRKHSRTQMGHRQDFTEVEITAIGGVTKKPAAKKAAVKKAAPVEAESVADDTKKAPAKKTAAKKTTAKKSESK